ncbi:glycerol-3-phosphate 1-O-acyltransferase PlsB [Pseudomonas savastanoi pv. phaseolicola]|uniref:Glycerol-3-phosphate acyltransferase n=3 Tax=Pseudomonas savastanoi TaxID=29438 RepID=PLSB_PSE14|nr:MULTISPECIES: glycerol-3-phosphate 1-O-acyltransferase PlsB [Pseudomonas]Q48F46.1 RecName: Full=Glycerol-3-phosphate acyltransferase; Short=GPAT [Pseudomonas savastanoi pv. phaseolicola 1448A]AAZ33585.1 glycerol-3-phosphate acyltransferase [Pseudomonas savastanoi pv. phaseolicola 1448A]KPB37398.1 Glycerol-3-phosphate acyltransferase [Pseudomonas savastanoi pv. phaseolicola]KPB38486.1 Glycerol-3-phosphate acyltransferase [Pseudomonas savastanoi pv. phaseolicola]KPB61929.1 Glycerol-3-phosphat
MTRSPFRRLVFGTLRRLLYLWVRSETINQSSFTLNLDRSRPVFYALQSPSISDLAVIDTECRKAGLPRPVLSVAVGNLIEPAAFFYLTPAPDWLGRQDKRGAPPTLERLVAAVSQNPGEDAQIIPVSVFWGQSPDRESSAWKLLFADSWAVTGRLRRLVSILILGRKTRVQFSAPIHMRELVGENKGYELTLRMTQRLLRVHFRNLKSAVIGPDVSHRRTVVKGLLDEPLVKQAIIEEAERENITQDKARDRALSYGNEIASDYTYSVIRFMEVVLSWFWNKIYDGIKVSHIEGVQEVAPGHEVIYVPCHRSHIDYLLLSYLLFCNGLTPPHIAAGINLNMPVVGSLLRRGGAFFMRRTFKGNPLYTAVFTEYLHTLFIKGFPVEYFVEGGRSRTGRMLQPKTGMLAITLRSFLRNSRMPIVFVPLYIGYERVLEGRTYLGELRGATKKKESIFDIFKVIGALKQRFGQVSVNFGAPIKLAEFLDGEQPDWREQALAPQFRPEWLSETTHRLGERVAQHLNEAAAVNPMNLVAVALLSTQRLALDDQAMERVLDLYLTLLRAVPYSPHTTLPEGDGRSLIEHVKGMDLLAEQKDALGKILYLNEQNAVLMTYYRNNVLHIFALPSLLASFFQSSSRMSREQILRYTRALYPFLQSELFIRWPLSELDEVVDQWLAAFVEQGLLRFKKDVYVRPEPSSREFVLLTLLSRAIAQTLQRFYMAIALLLNSGQNTLSAEQLEDLCTVMAQRLSILHGLNAPEFFDKSLFRHFIQTLLDLGVLRKDSAGKLSYHPMLGELAEGAAKRVLPAEIRLSIRQVALHSNEEEQDAGNGEGVA